MSALDDPQLMQTSCRATMSLASVADEALKVQDNLLCAIAITSEGVKGFGRGASLMDGGANLRREAVDVLRIVSIFRMIAGAFRERGAAYQRQNCQRTATLGDDHGLPPAYKGTSRPTLTPSDCSWSLPNEYE